MNHVGRVAFTLKTSDASRTIYDGNGVRAIYRLSNEGPGDLKVKRRLNLGDIVLKPLQTIDVIAVNIEVELENGEDYTVGWYQFIESRLSD